MILTLEDAQKVKPDVTQDEINGLEIAIRAITNNKFQIASTKTKVVEFDGSLIKLAHPVRGLKANDTIEVYGDDVNDGLFVVESVDGASVTVVDEFVNTNRFDVAPTLVKISYPADIVSGVRKLLTYDDKMADKVGIKSETISRMSTTYYDVNATENINGYPAAMMAFIDKYRKIRW